jgi:SAM-dependent methyltransferase
MTTDFKFTFSALQYLQRHKGDDYNPDRQVVRAVKQFELLKPILEKYSIQSMLDIGCGLAIASILIARHLNLKYLGLMDGDGTGEIFHDFRENGRAWNDVSIAEGLARANLDDMCRVEAFYPLPDLQIKYLDAIVSFKSWGTHYPIGEYIPLAHSALNPGGVIVVDLKPDDGIFQGAQITRMRNAGFELVERFGARRCLFRKQPL